MKKTVLIIVLGALVLVSLLVWAGSGQADGSRQEILMILVVVILAGIVGMAVVFLLSWLWVRFFGLKDE